MKALAQYIKDTGTTQRAFAERLGIRHEYLSRIINGHDNPGGTLARLIEHETQGAVKYQRGEAAE